jgi:hypothetical protein
MKDRTGISNRESAPEEAEERQQHPPRNRDSSSESADQPSGQSDELSELQTSHKTGLHSTARKDAGSKYVDSAQPASRKAEGAFGMEPEARADDEERELE